MKLAVFLSTTTSIQNSRSQFFNAATRRRKMNSVPWTPLNFVSGDCYNYELLGNETLETLGVPEEEENSMVSSSPSPRGRWSRVIDLLSKRIEFPGRELIEEIEKIFGRGSGRGEEVEMEDYLLMKEFLLGISGSSVGSGSSELVTGDGSVTKFEKNEGMKAIGAVWMETVSGMVSAEGVEKVIMMAVLYITKKPKEDGTLILDRPRPDEPQRKKIEMKHNLLRLLENIFNERVSRQVNN